MSLQKSTARTVLLDTSAVTPSTPTTLNGAINNAVTAIVVTSGAAIVNGTYITILAETSNTLESVFVTAGGGTANLTVVRAQLGTAASAHSTAATVNIGGALTYTLRTIAQMRNRRLQLQKISTDINYVVVTCGGANTFRNGGLTLLLVDTTEARGWVTLEFPAVGNIIYTTSGAGSQGIAGPPGTAGVPAPNLTSVTIVIASYVLSGNDPAAFIQGSIELPTSDPNYSHLKSIVVSGLGPSGSGISLVTLSAPFPGLSGTTLNFDAVTLIPISGGLSLTGVWTIVFDCYNESGSKTPTPLTYNVTIDDVGVGTVAGLDAGPHEIDLSDQLTYTTITVSPVLHSSHFPQNETLWISKGELGAAAISAPGSGYTNGTYALGFSGGGGTGAVGTFTVAGGVVSAVTITTPGKSYTSNAVFVFSGAGGSGAAGHAEPMFEYIGWQLMTAAGQHLPLRMPVPGAVETWMVAARTGAVQNSGRVSKSVLQTYPLGATVDAGFSVATLGAPLATGASGVSFSTPIYMGINAIGAPYWRSVLTGTLPGLLDTNAWSYAVTVECVDAAGNSDPGPDLNTAPFAGTCDTAGTAITWKTGERFNPSLTDANLGITINGVHYAVATYTDSAHLVLATSAGTQTGVAFSATGGERLKGEYVNSGVGIREINGSTTELLGNYNPQRSIYDRLRVKCYAFNRNSTVTPGWKDPTAVRQTTGFSGTNQQIIIFGAAPDTLGAGQAIGGDGKPTSTYDNLDNLVSNPRFDYLDAATFYKDWLITSGSAAKDTVSSQGVNSIALSGSFGVINPAGIPVQPGEVYLMRVSGALNSGGALSSPIFGVKFYDNAGAFVANSTPLVDVSSWTAGTGFHITPYATFTVPAGAKTMKAVLQGTVSGSNVWVDYVWIYRQIPTSGALSNAADGSVVISAHGITDAYIGSQQVLARAMAANAVTAANAALAAGAVVDASVSAPGGAGTGINISKLVAGTNIFTGDVILSRGISLPVIVLNNSGLFLYGQADASTGATGLTSKPYVVIQSAGLTLFSGGNVSLTVTSSALTAWSVNGSTTNPYTSVASTGIVIADGAGASIAVASGGLTITDSTGAKLTANAGVVALVKGSASASLTASAFTIITGGFTVTVNGSQITANAVQVTDLTTTRSLSINVSGGQGIILASAALFSASATTGAVTPPAQVAGYINFKDGSLTAFKIPYYNA